MGHAFDQDGNLLGEAAGETRSEVLAELERKYADAAKIEITKRLKELEQRIGTCCDTPIPTADFRAAMNEPDHE